MIVDYDENGKPISEEMYQHWADCATRGDFSEFEPNGEVVNGLPSLKKVQAEKKMLSFEVPSSVADDLSKLAKKQQMSRSNLLRSFVYEGLIKATA